VTGKKHSPKGMKGNTVGRRRMNTSEEGERWKKDRKKHRQGKKDRQYIEVMKEEKEECAEGRTERKDSLCRKAKKG
jgi:hypothetical protein